MITSNFNEQGGYHVTFLRSETLDESKVYWFSVQEVLHDRRSQVLGLRCKDDTRTIIDSNNKQYDDLSMPGLRRVLQIAISEGMLSEA